MSFALNFVEVYPVEAIYLEDLAPKLHELVPNLRERQTMKQETNRKYRKCMKIKNSLTTNIRSTTEADESDEHSQRFIAL